MLKQTTNHTSRTLCCFMLNAVDSTHRTYTSDSAWAMREHVMVTNHHQSNAYCRLLPIQRRRGLCPIRTILMGLARAQPKTNATPSRIQLTIWCSIQKHVAFARDERRLRDESNNEDVLRCVCDPSAIWRYTPARQSRHVFLPHIDASNSSHMLYVPRNKCMWFFASVLVNSLSPAPKSFRIHCVLVDGFSLTQELNLNDA